MSLKFSIITATYNSAASISDAVNSIKTQNYDNYEIVFIDGASSDNTFEIIKESTKEISDKVTLISEQDKGIYP